MKNTRIAGIASVSAAALILTACVAAAPDPSGSSEEQSMPAEATSFLNQSDLDIVERLPSTVPNARVRYDDNPLTYGDLRLPASGDKAADHPLVVLIHGGAWESSYTAEYFGQLAEALTDAGVATWNLEFRRLNNPGSAYPGMFLDIAHGVDFVRELAKEYPVDLDNVVLLGHSSGAQLAAWAAGRNNIPVDSELYSADPLDVRGVIDLAGVLDLEGAFAAGRNDILQVVGAVDAAGLAARAATTSPIALLPLGVPQTLIIGTEDSPWRLEAHDRYLTEGIRSGDTVELVTLKGANHFDVVDVCSPAWIPIVTAVLEYTDQPMNEKFTSSSPAVCAR